MHLISLKKPTKECTEGEIVQVELKVSITQNRVSQVFWDPIRNHVSPRSVLLKAVYLEALLYFPINTR